MLRASCLRCDRPCDDELGCAEHGSQTPLWRMVDPSYDAFAALLSATPAFPAYLPWPLGPDWHVSDAAAVTDRLDGSGRTLATLTACSGTSELDGPVDVLVVSERAGTGLGPRVAGIPGVDPGHEAGQGPPEVHVRIGPRTVALWSVSTSHSAGDLDRTVLAGTESGRWLWLVLRPAPAVLLLRDDWILRDVSGVGPPLVEIPFGGPAPPW